MSDTNAFGGGARRQQELAREAQRRAMLADDQDDGRPAPPIDRNTPTAKREDPDDAATRLNYREVGPTSPNRVTLKRLPLMRTAFVERLGAQLGLGRRMCARCMHFDKESFAAAMRAHPAFAQAADVLSPARMAAAKKRELDEIGQPVGHSEPVTWNDFGGCPKLGSFVPPNGTCDGWE